MRKPVKLLLGFASVSWVIPVSLLFAGYGQPLSPEERARLGPGELPPVEGVLVLGGCFCLLTLTAMTVFVLVDIFRNPRVAPNQRLLWVLLVFFVGVIALPLYWYFNVWREMPLPGNGPPRAPPPEAV